MSFTAIATLGWLIASQTSPATDSLPSSAEELERVVITGPAIESKERAAPVGITVITGEELARRNIRRLMQLFSGDVPGVYAVQTGAAQNDDPTLFFVRGGSNMLGTPESVPMKIYIDGVEMADGKYVDAIDPQSVERIEIVPGPQAAALYGSNALGGVMQIFTKRGTGAGQSARVTLMGESGLIENAFSSARTPQHETTAQLEHASAHASGTRSFMARVGWRHQGAWTPNRRTSDLYGSAGVADMLANARFDASYLRRTRDVSDALSLASGTRGETVLRKILSGQYVYAARDFLAPAEMGQNTQDALSATVSYTPLSWWRHTLTGGRSSSKNTRTLAANVVMPSDTLASVLEVTQSVTSVRYTTSATLAVTSFANVVASLGGDATNGLSVSTGGAPSATSSVLTPTSYERVPVRDRGGFAQMQLGVFDRMYATAGLRVQRSRSYGPAIGTDVAPTYGLSYVHETGVVTAKLRASYGRGTRPPTERQRYGTFVPATTLFPALYDPMPSLALRPESQRGWDGGLDLYVANAFSARITRYDQIVDDLILAVGNVDSVMSLRPIVGTIYAYYYMGQALNIGSVRNRGWETDASWTAGPLRLSTTYTMATSRVRSINAVLTGTYAVGVMRPGDGMIGMPEHLWASRVQYAAGRTSAEVSVNRTGSRAVMFGAPPVSADITYARLLMYAVRARATSTRMGLPGYTTLRLTGTHRVTSRLDVMATIDNATNVYPYAYYTAFPLPGRVSSAGLRLRL